MSRWKVLDPHQYINDLGSLGVLQLSTGLPFEAKRVFWISGVPAGTTRGFHAHRTGNQLLICLAGEISAKFYDGAISEEIHLVPGGSAVWMKNFTWGEQTFLQPNSILLVLASNEFDESDYIRDLVEFESLVQESE